MNRIAPLFTFLASLVAIIAPSCSGTLDADAPSGTAVYYWRTTLQLSPAEREFLQREQVGAIYLHIFDVGSNGRDLVPRNTLRFVDTIAAGIELIPTVFIEPDALSNRLPVDSLADRIIDRADKMLTANGYDRPAEIQVDFDWTLTNREAYFAILSQMHARLAAESRRLSTTIRLHQLAQTPPPVDYGVLMVYNVGNITDPAETNSILSEKRVRPYLRYLPDYRLPLATALPVYSWNVVFSQGRFKAIAFDLDLADTSAFTPIDSTHYRCSKYAPLPVAGTVSADGGRIFPGDMVRNEFIGPATLETTLQSIADARPGAVRRIILYHLDEKSLSRYDRNFIHSISHPCGN